MRRLELLLSETTSQAVTDHLQEGIVQSPLPINEVLVTRFRLSSEKSVNDDDFRKIAKALLPDLSALDKDERILDVPDVDLVTFPPITNWQKRRRNYYHLGHLFQDPPNGSDLRLIGLPHRFILVVYSSDYWVPIPDEPWNIGYWYNKYQTGIISLATKPTTGNIVVAQHELGHSFGLEHHKECLMAQGNNYNYKVRNREAAFCGDCVDKLSLFK